MYTQTMYLIGRSYIRRILVYPMNLQQKLLKIFDVNDTKYIMTLKCYLSRLEDDNYTTTLESIPNLFRDRLRLRNSSEDQRSKSCILQKTSHRGPDVKL